MLDPIPDVEWWDAHMLVNGSYDDVAAGRWDIKPEKINLYVEHPVPLEPPMVGTTIRCRPRIKRMCNARFL